MFQWITRLILSLIKSLYHLVIDRIPVEWTEWGETLRFGNSGTFIVTIFESQIILKSFGARKSKDKNRVHSTGILSIPKWYRLLSSISSNSMFVLIIWHQLNDLLLHLGTNILLEMTIKMVYYKISSTSWNRYRFKGVYYKRSVSMIWHALNVPCWDDRISRKKPI
jgi:hypothetical protein